MQFRLGGRKDRGYHPTPNEAWMIQMSCNMIDCETGPLVAKRKLIIDRDTKEYDHFRQKLEQSRPSIICLPTCSLNLNTYAERFVGSIKSNCLSRLIFFGEASLRRALVEYMAHSDLERNHPKTNNRLLNAAANDASYVGNVGSTSTTRRCAELLPSPPQKGCGRLNHDARRRFRTAA